MFRSRTWILPASMILLSQVTLAQEFQCTHPETGVKSVCAVVPATAAGTVYSGIYSLKNSTQAAEIEQKNTHRVYDSTRHSPLSATDNAYETKPYQDGDRVTINFRLSETANRNYHLDVLENQARSADSSAVHYRTQAQLALIPQTVQETYTETNSSGQLETKTRMVTKGPDYLSYLQYNGLAESEEDTARRLRREAADINAGRRSAPWHDFSKVIEEKSGMSESVNKAVTKIIADGGTVHSMTHIKQKYLVEIYKLGGKAFRGMLGVFAGVAFIIEEIAQGVVSSNLDSLRKGTLFESASSKVMIKPYDPDFKY